MSKCRGCAKAVYFAERKTSLGYDWHPECLRCEECHKRLNPGQHAEHKGVPYCHVPCYSVLFGPTLFGHGSQVEAHTSFGKVEQRAGLPVPRSHLEAKLRLYNQQHEGKSTAVQCRERNGRLILEGSLRISWGVCHMIHLKEEHDDRMPVRRRNSCRLSIENSSRISSQDLVKLRQQQSPEWESPADSLVNGSSRSLQSSPSHRAADSQSTFGRNYKTLPAGGLKNVSNAHLEDENKENAGALGEMLSDDGEDLSGVQLRRGGRCSRTKLRRRCSINGHFYNRETSVFMPGYGSLTSVWVTSLVTTPEVINMLLDKFKVQNKAEDFSLFVVRDSGEQRRIQDNEYPLLVRILLGPNEDVAKVFILEKNRTQEITNEVLLNCFPTRFLTSGALVLANYDFSQFSLNEEVPVVKHKVAQFINLSEVELTMFVKKFNEEEEREAQKIKEKYKAMKRYIAGRLYQLKPKEVK